MNRESKLILVVDDDPDILWALRRNLGDEGYEVLTARDGVEALKIAPRHRPDLIILDISMPRLDGLQVCHNLRRDPTLASVPILFLTAREAVEDRIKGLEEGADDYLVKPFDLRELKARVRALFRRARSSSRTFGGYEETDSLLVVGDLVLDERTFQVRLKGKSIQLTAAEFELLYYLMMHPGEIFTSKELLHQVWRYPVEAMDSSLVRKHIRNLRAKIEPDPVHPIYIRTVLHHGYILEVHPSTP